jgi:predicted phosphate transport protein (TIGR00153 family)
MALNLFRRIMPPEESFTELFCELTERIVDGARELRAMVDGKGPVETHVAKIRSIESAADGVARKIFLAANRTFNAPIDREDLLELANDLDDTVDLIEDTAKGIQRYGIETFSTEIRAMADAVVQSAELLAKVMPFLDSITTKHREIFALCEQVGHVEERADQSFDAALLRLRGELRAGTLDTVGYIDRKEIFELMEDVVDKCDDVANAVQTITAKHV